MIPVLDSSILMNLEKGKTDFKKKISELSEKYDGEPVIAFMTYLEFLMGIKGRSKENQEKAMGFVNKFGILKVNKETAEILSELKYDLEKKGIALPLADLLIAAQVIENRMILVTTDKDFEKIEELKKIIL